MDRLIFWGLLIALIPSSAVIAASPFTTAQQDAAAKRFQADAEKATIYVYRDQRLLGATAVLPVIVNGRVAGATAPRSYFVWRLEPGDITISSMTAEKIATVELKVKPGELYFVRQKALFGFANPGVSLQVVGQQDGRSAVLKCKRLKSAF